MQSLIDGKWIDRDKKITVYDPFDNSIVDTVPACDISDADLAVLSGLAGFNEIKKMSVYDRSQILLKTAQIVKDNLEDFAVTIAREGSKTIREARKEASRCVNTLMVSYEESRRIVGETIPFDSFAGGECRKGYYYRFPIGLVLCITPFNDPLNLVAHKLGPAFAAGNAVVLKPASVTPLSAIKLAKAFLDAGLPPKALNVITGYGSEIGDHLVKNDAFRMISFTGGLEAGKRITALGGIKKIGMELGSNSPVIVWKDADLDLSAESCVSGAFWAAGQNCIGVQRIYIHREIYENFRDRFVHLTKKYRSGDKLNPDTDMGPMITEEEAIRVERWVKEAVNEGALVLTGGNREKALYYPTVLENVNENSRIYRDEVFGPVVNLFPVDTLDEAIEKANSLPFGLHSAIFTNNVDIAFKAAYNIDCGGIMINESTDYRLDSMPFGGIKNSGLGREGIKYALMEMTEPKVISFYIR